MGGFLSFIMAIFFLIAGIVCINKPKQLLQWVVKFFMNAEDSQGEAPAWTQGYGIILFIRILGFLSLLNFTLELSYLTR